MLEVGRKFEYFAEAVVAESEDAIRIYESTIAKQLTVYAERTGRNVVISYSIVALLTCSV